MFFAFTLFACTADPPPPDPVVSVSTDLDALLETVILPRHVLDNTRWATVPGEAAGEEQTELLYAWLAVVDNAGRELNDVYGPPLPALAADHWPGNVAKVLLPEELDDSHTRYQDGSVLLSGSSYPADAAGRSPWTAQLILLEGNNLMVRLSR